MSPRGKRETASEIVFNCKKYGMFTGIASRVQRYMSSQYCSSQLGCSSARCCKIRARKRLCHSVASPQPTKKKKRPKSKQSGETVNRSALASVLSVCPASIALRFFIFSLSNSLSLFLEQPHPHEGGHFPSFLCLSVLYALDLTCA